MQRFYFKIFTETTKQGLTLAGTKWAPLLLRGPLPYQARWCGIGPNGNGPNIVGGKHGHATSIERDRDRATYFCSMDASPSRRRPRARAPDGGRWMIELVAWARPLARISHECRRYRHTLTTRL